MRLGILFILFVPWDTAKAYHAIIIEEVSICAPNSKIVTNYTYTRPSRKGPVGEYEILEEIASNSNIQLSTSIRYISNEKLPFKIPMLNATNINLCVFINTDLHVLPFLRQFIDLEKHCPLKRGVYKMNRNSILINNRYILPNGCWKFTSKLQKNGKMFACFQVSFRVLPSLNSDLFKCNEG